MPEELDLETMPLDQLRNLAVTNNAELPEDKPRDEQGRFVKPEGKIEVAEAEEVDQIVYRQVIDLGDGSGSQVFEAETLEELVQKLAKAQEHATRKIREQAAELSKKAEAPPVVDPQEEANRKWLRSQELAADPDAVIDKKFEDFLGMTKEKFKTRLAALEAFEANQRGEQAGKEFTEKHPEYFKSQKNASKIQKYITKFGLPETLESIETAYADLSESGLLETGPADAASQNSQEERIAQPGQSTTKRVASGLSSKRSSSVSRPTGPTEEELYKMPYDKLRELALQAERNQQ